MQSNVRKRVSIDETTENWELTVRFRPTRGRVLGVSLVTLNGAVVVDLKPRSDWSWSGRGEVRLTGDEDLVLSITFVGNIPTLASLEVDEVEGGYIPQPAHAIESILDNDPITFDRNSLRIGQPQDQADRKRSMEEYCAALHFFADLDHESLLGNPIEYERTAYILFFGIEGRVAHARELLMPPQVVEQGDREFVRGLIRPASDMIKTISRRHFGYDNDGRKFSWAFELFATNRLFIPDENIPNKADKPIVSAPDGPLFYLFAQLALYCIELDVDQDFWRARATSLVRASQIFTEHSLRSVDTRPMRFTSPNGLVFSLDYEYPLSRIRVLRELYSSAIANLTRQLCTTCNGENRDCEDHMIENPLVAAQLFGQILRVVFPDTDAKSAGGDSLNELLVKLEVPWSKEFKNRILAHQQPSDPVPSPTQ